MKIEALKIVNFRGISHLEVAALSDTIIIAGQNGSGKSCIFDAIRLLKSTYGGYQQNEWQHFFGEFQIQLNGGAKNLEGLFNDASKDCIIECVFKLRSREKAYIRDNAARLLEQTIWQALLPEAFQYGGYRQALFAQQFREKQPEVTARVQFELPLVLEELEKPELVGRIVVSVDGRVEITSARLLSVVFSNYSPRNIGVIDFHGAQRHYGREHVQGINLNLDQISQTQSQHTLYNYSGRYNNVKSEMAGNYVKEILAEQAGGGSDRAKPLAETLKELFESFFPDKRFLGPKPTPEGSLAFPVLTQGGTVHDLDELSSGEKEILYGYLRIRSSAPRDSIILLDEPELHLNPRLIRGLPEFYRKHLGEALQNQLWLVTHSDALIREAVGKPGFSVFHMLPCGAEGAQDSQLKPLTVSKDLERALTDLVGDLAAYRPGGKALIFEGGGDSDFDKTFVSALFGNELKGFNLISGSNKARVAALHQVLERAYTKGDLSTKFYAVTDRDSDDSAETKGVARYSWDVYHIENYLLEPDIIAQAINSFNLKSRWTARQVTDALEIAARAVVPSMIEHRLRVYVNAELVKCIKLKVSANTDNVSEGMGAAIAESHERLVVVQREKLNAAELSKIEADLRSKLEQSFTDGSWARLIPGRDILQQFVASSKLKISYEVLRNLIVSKMADTNFKPQGMERVIVHILKA